MAHGAADLAGREATTEQRLRRQRRRVAPGNRAAPHQRITVGGVDDLERDSPVGAAPR